MDPASMPSFLMKWETQKRVGGVRYKKKYVEVWFSFSHANLLAQNTKEVTCDTQCHDHTHRAISSVNKSLGGTEQIKGGFGWFCVCPCVRKYVRYVPDIFVIMDTRE